jgi:DNA-binding Xre family transcriptional regulator
MTAVSGKKAVSYRWHLRRLMAEAGMFATTDMGPPLAARGIDLSREQVYRLVAGVPERLSLPVLAALCDILDCGPGDLIEPVRRPPRGQEAAAEPAARPRPVRARVVPGPGAR